VYRAMQLVQKKKKRMQNGTSRDFESAPAANDRDSYKQPLLASLEVMIGSMRHLDGRNLVGLEGRNCAGKYIPIVAASFINSYRQPTARHSGSRGSHHQMNPALGQSTTRESVLRMSYHLLPLQTREKMARASAKMGLSVLAVERGEGLRIVEWLREWGE
jgi:hypothetical protein